MAANVKQLRYKAGNMMFRDFWEAGYRIFPLNSILPGGRCACGKPECEAIGKHPTSSNWQHTPMWDDDQIDTMEEYQITTGYGVLCKGLLVVDIDARNGGVASWEALLKDVPGISGAGLAVATGSGGGSRHLYYKAPADVALVAHLPKYPGIDFKSSGFVVGPGSCHVSGGIYTADGTPCDIEDAPAELVALLTRPDRKRSEYNGHAIDLADADLADMLDHIPNNDLIYEEWIAIGMALHHASHGTAYQIWEDWSATSSKHNPKQMEYKWHSFGKSANPVTVGTLIHYAEKGGWTMPVEFTHDMHLESDPAPDGLPFDISGVDLTQPPGFVGDVARWLNLQSQFPRKHLAVGAALFAIGNIGGLKYVDDVSDVTSNVLVFCIAESGTGKEGILQGAVSLMQAAGLGAACYGRIKSDKEFLANSIRHQMMAYTIDEIGEFLQKVENARTKGGATYLEGVYGRIMEIFSKATPGKVMVLGGADRDEVRNMLQGELAKISKALDEKSTPWLERRLEETERLLGMLDTGIERPFLSLLGVTTPNKFEDIMSPEMARSGFIGRAMMFNERINVPDGVFGHKAPPLPESLSDIAKVIWSGGSFDMFEGSRIENYEEPIRIPSTPGARAMLESLYPWRLEKAKAEEESTGLHTLWNRFYEAVAKVSLILSMAEQLRTEEHVRWAFALCKRDIEEKIRLVGSNRSGGHEKEDALIQRIISILGDEQMTDAVIYNRIRNKYRREDVMKALEKMVDAKILVMDKSRHAGNGKMVRKFSKA